MTTQHTQPHKQYHNQQPTRTHTHTHNARDVVVLDGAFRFVAVVAFVAFVRVDVFLRVDLGEFAAFRTVQQRRRDLARFLLLS